MSMIEKNYPSIEVKLGNYIRRFEMRETYIGTFVVDNKLFNVIGTGHSMDMLAEREIDKYHVMSSIIGMGKKLSEYNNNNKHIIISDEKKGISTVFTIENYTVVIITVIDKGKVYISANGHKPTIYENEMFEDVG
jgi:hypothetical protein